MTWVLDSPVSADQWRAVACSADGNNVMAVSETTAWVRGPAPPPRLPPSPRLAINRSGTELGLSWLVPSTPFVLQQSFDLGPPNWVDVPDAPALDCANLNYRVTLTPSLSHAYYRLKQR
jgi:hypothetical protein